MIAQGFTRMARKDSLEFYRLDTEGRNMQMQILALDDVLRGGASNIPLLPGDRIVVRGTSEQRADYRVQVVGEIVHPGT